MIHKQKDKTADFHLSQIFDDKMLNRFENHFKKENSVKSINCSDYFEYLMGDEEKRALADDKKLEKIQIMDGSTDEFNVHGFNNDELRIYESVNIHKSYLDEIKGYYDALADKMKETVKEIVLIKGDTGYGGYTDIMESLNDMGRLYIAPESSYYTNTTDTLKDGLHHEMAHLLDTNPSRGLWGLSSDLFKDAFKTDKTIIQKTMFQLETQYHPWYEGFTTQYSQIHYNDFKNHPALNVKRYSEDFAESIKFYLNENHHRTFINIFENKARLIENIIF